jgi:hypothetical protein
MWPIIWSSQIIHERRDLNQAIKAHHDVQLLVLLCKLPPTKLDEYEQFPLLAQFEFIHAIPEDAFNIASATVVDIFFLGLFPKKIFQPTQQYGNKVKRHDQTGGDVEYHTLVNDLIHAFAYHLIAIQKVIHILLAHHKCTHSLLEKEMETSKIDIRDDNAMAPSLSVPVINKESSSDTPVAKKKRKCYAN